MNVLWQNAALAGLGSLIAVPLLVHLLARARPPVKRFPSLFWITPAVKKSLRLRRPADWLLLVLRTVLIALLVAAFLQPLWLDRRAPAAGQQKVMVLLVDRTASMAWAGGGPSRWAQAVEQADALLAGAGGSVRTNVVWLDAVPEAVLPEPGTSPGFLMDQLRRGTVSPEAGNLPAALSLAVDQLMKSDGARELVILSDFQETGWKNADLTVPPSVTLTPVRVGAEAGANLAVTALTTDPRQPVAGSEVRLSCEVRNFSAEARRTTLYLEAGESRRSVVVELAPWGQALPEFRMTFPRAGAVPLRALIDEDAFPVDDARDGVLNVREALSLTIVAKAEDSGSAGIWQRAAEALGWIRVALRTDLPGASETLPDVLLAVRPAAEMEAGLTQLAERGCGVMIEPGPGWQGAVEEKQTPAQPGWRLGVQDDTAPILRDFAGGTFGDPAAGEFRRRLAGGGAAGADGKVLFVWADGVPAVSLRSAGKGRILTWGATPDPAWSTFAQQPAFLPLLAETWIHLTPPASVSRQALEAGQPLAWTPPGQSDPGPVTLTDSSGRVVDLHRPEGTGAPWASVESLPPGAYQWRLAGEIVEPAAITFPALESDLRALPETGMGTAGNASSPASLAAAGRWGEGLPLWPAALMAGVVVLLSEGWVARRAMAATPVPA